MPKSKGPKKLIKCPYCQEDELMRTVLSKLGPAKGDAPFRYEKFQHVRIPVIYCQKCQHVYFERAGMRKYYEHCQNTREIRFIVTRMRIYENAERGWFVNIEDWEKMLKVFVKKLKIPDIADYKERIYESSLVVLRTYLNKRDKELIREDVFNCGGDWAFLALVVHVGAAEGACVAYDREIDRVWRKLEEGGSALEALLLKEATTVGLIRKGIADSLANAHFTVKKGLRENMPNKGALDYKKGWENMFTYLEEKDFFKDVPKTNLGKIRENGLKIIGQLYDTKKNCIFSDTSNSRRRRCTLLGILNFVLWIFKGKRKDLRIELSELLGPATETIWFNTQNVENALMFYKMN